MADAAEPAAVAALRTALRRGDLEEAARQIAAMPGEGEPSKDEAALRSRFFRILSQKIGEARSAEGLAPLAALTGALAAQTELPDLLLRSLSSVLAAMRESGGAVASELLPLLRPLLRSALLKDDLFDRVLDLAADEIADPASNPEHIAVDLSEITAHWHRAGLEQLDTARLLRLAELAGTLAERLDSEPQIAPVAAERGEQP